MRVLELSFSCLSNLRAFVWRQHGRTFVTWTSPCICLFPKLTSLFASLARDEASLVMFPPRDHSRLFFFFQFTFLRTLLARNDVHCVSERRRTTRCSCRSSGDILFTTSIATFANLGAQTVETDQQQCIFFLLRTFAAVYGRMRTS